MKPEIAAAFDEHAFESGLTYTSHPISLAAAVANIEAMREDKIVEHTAGMGAVLRRKMLSIWARRIPRWVRCGALVCSESSSWSKTARRKSRWRRGTLLRLRWLRCENIVCRSRLVPLHPLAYGVDHSAIDH
jgi:adenosylmethionine-8-amino-7-oxononanoate aminotransferase